MRYLNRTLLVIPGVISLANAFAPPHSLRRRQLNGNVVTSTRRYASTTELRASTISTSGQDDPITTTTASSGKPAYVVIEARLRESEMERFGRYASQVPALVSKFGGEYLVLGGQHEPLEGEWDSTRIVLHRWPSAEQAREFWDSGEYQELKKLREGTGEFRIMLLEGLEMKDVFD